VLRVDDDSLPPALAEPVAPVRPGWIGLLFAANIGMWLAVYAPLQVLLPEQVQSLHDHVTSSAAVPSGRDAVLLSAVMVAGAVASLLANPVIGALSDRTTSSRGRRHPWTAGCALVGAAGIGIVAAAPDIPVMAAGWFVAEFGLGGMLATLTAALPDRVPVRQRGTLGALIGISQMLGTVLGAAIVTVLVTRMPAGYATCAIILLACAAAWVLLTPDDPLPSAFKPEQTIRQILLLARPIKWRSLPSGAHRGAPGHRGPGCPRWALCPPGLALWISPREHPDLGWAWLTHCLINLGNDLGTLYLLYFLADDAHYRDPQTGLLILMLLYAVALLAGGTICGTLSDRTGRRKPFVIGSAAVMAVAAALLVISPTWNAALPAAPLLGAGFGIYWAAAPALLTQVLPAATDRGKDLGLINIGYSFPLVLAPLIAGVVLGLLNSYPALFALAGIVTVGGGFAVSKVRSVA
jgi:MFS family permease